MAAQKWKKKLLPEIVSTSECIFKTHLIKALNSRDSSRPYGRLLENPKTGGFRESFLPEKNFKTCSAVSFPKKHPYFGSLESSQRHKIQTWIFFTCSSTYELDII